MSHPASEESCASTEVNSAASRLHAELQAAGAQSEKLQDILTVIPLNTEARRAFDTVAQAAKKGSLDALHAQYVCITGEQSLEHEPGDAGNETGETSEDEAPTPRPTIILAGYYRLQFALAAVSKTPTWVIGRGSGQKFGPTRNVDIILVAPGTKGTPGLAAAHVYLSICTDSGAWRIAAGAKMQVEDESYQPGDSIHLYQPKTRIQILNMQYLIRFEVDTEELEVEYIKVRNKMLRKEGFTLPHTDISGIPFQGDMVFTTIVFRHGIGSGTFGSVYEGFGPKNGKLRVAKRIILRSALQAPEVSREIQALQRFNGSVGILELIDWRTSLNGKNLIVAQYPLDVYLIHDKGVAFDKFDWSTVSWSLKRSLCHQLLSGLTTIHEAGCMHRDITPMNILVFPYQHNPQATICDFGKFCSTSTDTETRLAGWKYLPSELQKGEDNLYDQKLDIWMLGLALTYSWWPHTTGLHPRHMAEYNNMLMMLCHRTSDPMGDLLACMMAWDPRKRPMATEALDHKALRQYSASKTLDKVSTAKRSHGAST
ncbi:MAG: hypothetical protein Q9215_002666 [Flavoplaca cf. flavocitrina]